MRGNIKTKTANQVANHVVPGKLMIKRVKLPNLAAQTVAMLAPTLNPIKVPVLFALKANIKTKMINPDVNHVVPGNTMINKDKLPNLVAKTIAMPDFISWIKVHASIAFEVNTKTKTTNQVVNNVLLENTMIDKDDLVATMIAMLVPTLNPTKPHV